MYLILIATDFLVLDFKLYTIKVKLLKHPIFHMPVFMRYIGNSYGSLNTVTTVAGNFGEH